MVPGTLPPVTPANQEKAVPAAETLTTAQKVSRLEKEGLDPSTIARTLGITLGEVELIQSLRRNQA